MFSLPVLVFNIQTIADLAAGKRLHGLNLTDADAELALSNLRRQVAGHDVPALPLHEVVCVSGLWIEDGQMRLWSLSQQQLSEAELITQVVAHIAQRPCHVWSWNGTEFDVPVLLYRAMRHALSAAELLPLSIQPDGQSPLSHTDLMQTLAFQHGHVAALDDMAQWLGLPVLPLQSAVTPTDWVRTGDWEALCAACEREVITTWLLALRWQLLSGRLDAEQHEQWLQHSREFLAQHPRHRDGFLQAFA